MILCIAYVTLFERKVLAAVQLRKGPNKVGVFGLLQPLMDAVKLLLKEIIFPSRVNLILFIVGPVLMLILNLVS